MVSNGSRSDKQSVIAHHRSAVVCPSLALLCVDSSQECASEERTAILQLSQTLECTRAARSSSLACWTTVETSTATWQGSSIILEVTQPAAAAEAARFQITRSTPLGKQRRWNTTRTSILPHRSRTPPKIETTITSTYPSPSSNRKGNHIRESYSPHHACKSYDTSDDQRRIRRGSTRDSFHSMYVCAHWPRVYKEREH